MAVAKAQNSAYERVSPKLVSLDPSRLPEVCLLEELSYTSPWSRSLLARELQKNEALMPGVVLDERLVAQSFNAIVSDELHILNLSVHPDFRGLGLGKRLLAYILASAIREGAAYATLEVRGQNHLARNLYRKLEFRFVGIRKGYYQDNGEDAFLLERRLFPSDFNCLSELSGFSDDFRGLT